MKREAEQGVFALSWCNLRQQHDHTHKHTYTHILNTFKSFKALSILNQQQPLYLLAFLLKSHQQAVFPCFCQ